MGDGAAGCSIDERESLRPLGTAWNLFASGAMECRPVSWLASGFPGGLWTDGAAFSRAECLMKLNRFCDERFLCVKCGKFQLAIVQYVK